MGASGKPVTTSIKTPRKRRNKPPNKRVQLGSVLALGILLVWISVGIMIHASIEFEHNPAAMMRFNSKNNHNNTPPVMDLWGILQQRFRDTTSTTTTTTTDTTHHHPLAWLPHMVAAAAADDPGISEERVLEGLQDLLEARWHANQEEATRHNSSSRFLSRELLQSLQEYTSRRFGYDGTRQTNTTAGKRNQQHSFLRRRSSQKQFCWIPGVFEQACDQQSYIVLAPVTTNSHQMTTQQLLRRVLLHTLQWLYDPNAVQIYLLFPNTVVVGAGLEGLATTDPMYGARLLAWHKDTHHPVTLIVADSLPDALRQVVAVLQLQSTPAAAAAAVVWRSVQEPLVPLILTRQHIAAGLQTWRQQSTALVAFSTRSVEMDLKKNAALHPLGEDEQREISVADDITNPNATARGGSTNTSSTAGSISNNQVVVVLDWNGLIHHVDYLCMMASPQGGDKSWSWPLFQYADDNEKMLPPWGLMLALGHLSPVPWKFYSGRPDYHVLLDNAIANNNSTIHTARQQQQLRHHRRMILHAALLWGGFPPLWTNASNSSTRTTQPETDLCVSNKTEG